MTFKITNALRIISIIVLVVVFFISYAGLPEQVLVLINDKDAPARYLDKNYYFYGVLVILILTNVLIYILAMLMSKSTKQKAQIMAKYLLTLAIVINIFFSVAQTFIGILNGQENFDYATFAPFMYLSPVLFGVWIVTFIFSLIKSKNNV
jgi:peptidoglycan biosynthesis protein MviN/MurJ (putative lipid II flippase)